MALGGVIFDMDGTLVDSALDFDLMRREMELPASMGILEALTELPREHAERCRQILHQHEHRGARCATVMPGVPAFLQALRSRGLRQAIITRNCRAATVATLDRLLPGHFDPIVCRENGPVKPDPAAIWGICRDWRITPAETVIVGDYAYDMEAGRAAGAGTVLFTDGRAPDGLPGQELADFILPSFADSATLLAWLDQFGRK